MQLRHLYGGEYIAECIFLVDSVQIIICLGPTTLSTTSCDTKEEGDSLINWSCSGHHYSSHCIGVPPCGCTHWLLWYIASKKRTREKGELQGGVIYEEPVVQSAANTVAIPLSENQAYGQIPPIGGDDVVLHNCSGVFQ